MMFEKRRSWVLVSGEKMPRPKIGSESKIWEMREEAVRLAEKSGGGIVVEGEIEVAAVALRKKGIFGLMVETRDFVVRLKGKNGIWALDEEEAVSAFQRMQVACSECYEEYLEAKRIGIEKARGLGVAPKEARFILWGKGEVLVALESATAVKIGNQGIVTVGKRAASAWSIRHWLSLEVGMAVEANWEVEAAVVALALRYPAEGR